MMEFAKFTGKRDGNLYQIRLRTGEHVYAPIAVAGISSPAPSEDWVSKNKDKFLALLSMEGSSNHVVIGFYPVQGAVSTEYNIFERLLEVNILLIDQLLKAKTNTSIGPMPFMPDTIKKLQELKLELSDIDKLIKPIKNA